MRFDPIASTMPVPADSIIPPTTDHDIAGPHDYDQYFGLERDDIKLSEWTRGCLTLERELLSDLNHANVSDADRADMLAGLAVLYRTTLERWLSSASGL